jgi:DNA-binding XRE family transcriptional regulator
VPYHLLQAKRRHRRKNKFPQPLCFAVSIGFTIVTVADSLRYVNPHFIRQGQIVITSGQIKAARALLGWTQVQLAEAAGIGEISVKNIERGVTDARASTLTKIQAAFEKAGVQFIADGAPSLEGGVGLRLK